MPEELTDGVVALRPWRRSDVAALVECLDGEEQVTRWLDMIPQPYTAADARAYLEGPGRDAFAITDAATGRVLGSIGVRWSENGDVGEAGYWLRADARGRGLTARALVLVSRWALARDGVARLQLRAATDNVASRRTAERAGYRLEGVLRSAHWSPRLDRRVDWAMYSLLPGELA